MSDRSSDDNSEVYVAGTYPYQDAQEDHQQGVAKLFHRQGNAPSFYRKVFPICQRQRHVDISLPGQGRISHFSRHHKPVGVRLLCAFAMKESAKHMSPPLRFLNP